MISPTLSELILPVTIGKLRLTKPAPLLLTGVELRIKAQSGSEIQETTPFGAIAKDTDQISNSMETKETTNCMDSTKIQSLHIKLEAQEKTLSGQGGSTLWAMLVV